MKPSSLPRQTMYHDFEQILPVLPPTEDVFASRQTTHQFYAELRHRQELERYCQWYEAVAQQHQRELQKMQGDINLFGWFWRG